MTFQFIRDIITLQQNERLVNEMSVIENKKKEYEDKINALIKEATDFGFSVVTNYFNLDTGNIDSTEVVEVHLNV